MDADRQAPRRGVFRVAAFLLVSLCPGIFPGSAFAQNSISTGTNSGFRMYRAGTDWWLDPSKGNFDIRVNGLPAVVTLNALGNLGIGTAAPDLTLHVDGSNGYPASGGSSPAGFLTLRDKNRNASHGLFMGVANAAPWGSWLQAQDANNLATNYPLLLNPNGGSVGIGTTNPAANLEVVGPTGGIAKIRAGSGADSGAGVLLGTNNGIGRLTLFDVSGAGNGDLVNTTGGWRWTNQLNILGNVGIGTTSPNYKLDVQGGSINTQYGINAATGAFSTSLTVNGSNVLTSANGGFTLVFSTNITTGISSIQIPGLGANDYYIRATLQLAFTTSIVGGDLWLTTNALNANGHYYWGVNWLGARVVASNDGGNAASCISLDGGGCGSQTAGSLINTAANITLNLDNVHGNVRYHTGATYANAASGGPAYIADGYGMWSTASPGSGVTLGANGLTFTGTIRVYSLGAVQP